MTVVPSAVGTQTWFGMYNHRVERHLVDIGGLVGIAGISESVVTVSRGEVIVEIQIQVYQERLSCLCLIEMEPTIIQ